MLCSCLVYYWKMIPSDCIRRAQHAVAPTLLKASSERSCSKKPEFSDIGVFVCCFSSHGKGYCCMPYAIRQSMIISKVGILAQRHSRFLLHHLILLPQAICHSQVHAFCRNSYARVFVHRLLVLTSPLHHNRSLSIGFTKPVF